jgi:transcriptional regulator with XRE-family HTH domain
MLGTDMRLIRLERLKLALERQGVSRAELAGRMGVNPSYLTDLLKPESNKSFGEKAARKAEKALGLDPGWLDDVAAPDPRAGLSAELLGRIAQLSPQQRAGLEGVIRAHLATIKGAPGNGEQAA